MSEDVKHLRSILLLAEERARDLLRKESSHTTLRSVCQNVCAANIGWKRQLDHFLREMEMLECVGEGRLFVSSTGEV